MIKYTKGEKSNKAILDVIMEAQGLSMYELGRRIGWKTGHVDGAVRRLLQSQKVILKIIERNGRRVNLVYPRDNNKPSNIVEVPKNLLKVGNPTWQKEAFVYALDSNTIGISGEDNENWSSFACFKNEVEIVNKDTNIYLTLPQKIVDFYNLESRHVVKTINGNNVLLTVSGNIIETKKYPS